MANDYLQNVLGQDYAEQDITKTPYVKITNGKFQFIIIDIDKPDKVFFDLTKVFNASTGEAEKILPIQFVRGGKVITDMTGYSISMDGTYPDNSTPFHVQGELMNSATGAFINFKLPLGLFQAVGVYNFQFTITNTSTGDKETSHFMFFNVTQNATTLGVDWANGVNPFDSDYIKWKQEVIQYHQQEIDYLTSLNESASKIQKQLDSVDANINDTIDTGWQDKLNGENTWTGKQHFNGGLTASDIDTQSIEYHSELLADKGNDLESGLFVHDEAVVAESDGKGQATLLNGVGDNSSGFGYISFDLFSGKDYKGVTIHANCKVPKSCVGKPIVQFSKNYGLDQTPFRLGDYVMKFDWTSNTLYCLAYMSSNQGNEICQGVITIL